MAIESYVGYMTRKQSNSFQNSRKGNMANDRKYPGTAKSNNALYYWQQ